MLKENGQENREKERTEGNENRQREQDDEWWRRIMKYKE